MIRANMTDIIDRSDRDRIHEILVATARFTAEEVRCAMELVDQTLDHPERGRWHNVGMPIKLSGSPADIKRSPLLGEHTDEILTKLCGYSSEAVAELRGGGVV